MPIRTTLVGFESSVSVRRTALVRGRAAFPVRTHWIGETVVCQREDVRGRGWSRRRVEKNGFQCSGVLPYQHSSRVCMASTSTGSSAR